MDLLTQIFIVLATIIVAWMALSNAGEIALYKRFDQVATIFTIVLAVIGAGLSVDIVQGWIA